VLTGTRSRILQVGLILLTCAVPSACRKRTPEQVEQGVPPQNPAQLRREAESAKQSLAELRPPLAALQATFVALHREFDALPPGLPGFGETRAKFYAASVGLGTLGTKVALLSERINAALSQSPGAELSGLSKDVRATAEQLRQMDAVAAQLRKEVQPFKQRVEERIDLMHAGGDNKCE
jgi:hypothetical protein